MLKSLTHRKLYIMAFDFTVLLATALVGLYIVHNISGTNIGIKDIIASSLLYAVLNFFMISVIGEYRKAWKFLSVKDILSSVGALAVGSALTYALDYFAGIQIVNKYDKHFVIYILLTFGVSATIFVVSRIVAKRYFIRIIEAGQEDVLKRALIIGAGNAGRMIITEIDNARNSGNREFSYNIVGIVDDDPNKLNEKINSHNVIGTTKDIEEVCDRYSVDVIFFAIPSCPAPQRAEILERCSNTRREVKIMPELSKLIIGQSIVKQVTKVNVEDLLGRDPVELDTTALEGFIKDKVCMVTGGGGSIGSELCRQIMSYSPKKLIIVDIYENNAYDIQQELFMNKMADSSNLKVLIASVRDEKKMEKIFAEYQPQLVFHAAAHKHVPLMETSPEEAVKNNVFGTLNIAQLSDKYGAQKFVLVSTDKAVNPTNVMGATKRLCEMIVQYFSNTSENTEYVAVRFGNVLGSNGSVIPLFKKQIESGKPITITHPDIIRYFMTIPEAVSLILAAGSMASGGEIFVLDMGEPVKILTLAENLIKIYGKKPYEDVKIIFTGLRPGEKLYEELLMSEEGLQKTKNQKIFIGTQIDVDDEQLAKDLEALRKTSRRNNSDAVVKQLEEIVPTFNHKTNK